MDFQVKHDLVSNRIISLTAQIIFYVVAVVGLIKKVGIPLFRPLTNDLFPTLGGHLLWILP